jgi:L-threonylcarbamoyladenylate synthase
MGLAAPSANQFGRVSPTTAQHVQGEFGEDLLILDGGPVPSASSPPSSTAPAASRCCCAPVPSRQTRCRPLAASVCYQKKSYLRIAAPAPRASGTLESHYAPKARVRLMDAKTLQTALDLLGADIDGAGQVIATYSRVILKSRSIKVLRRRMPDDAAATAQQLFAVLREFDAQGVKLIWVETPPDAPEWDGVRDRLERILNPR